MVEGDSFAIFDNFFSNPVQTVQSLEKMQQDGKVRNEVQGLLTRGLKIYLTLLDFHKRGITDAKQIIAETKLHPFVVNKNLKQLPNISQHQLFLTSFFKSLIELEYAIKTGKYHDSYYRLAVKEQILQAF